MNKKGDITRTTLFLGMLVGIALIGLVFTRLSLDLAKGDIVQRQYLATDLALFQDTLYALPGDVDFIYLIPRFNEEQELNITNDSISIRQKLTKSFSAKFPHLYLVLGCKEYFLLPFVC